MLVFEYFTCFFRVFQLEFTGTPIGKKADPPLYTYAEDGRYSPKIPVRVCAAQRGRDFGTPDLED